MCGAGARGTGSHRPGEPWPNLDRYVLRSRRRAANDNGRLPSAVVRTNLVIWGMALAGALAFVTLVVLQ